MRFVLATMMLLLGTGGGRWKAKAAALKDAPVTVPALTDLPFAPLEMGRTVVLKLDEGAHVVDLGAKGKAWCAGVEIPQLEEPFVVLIDLPSRGNWVPHVRAWLYDADKKHPGGRQAGLGELDFAGDTEYKLGFGQRQFTEYGKPVDLGKDPAVIRPMYRYIALCAMALRAGDSAILAGISGGRRLSPNANVGVTLRRMRKSESFSSYTEFRRE